MRRLLATIACVLAIPSVAYAQSSLTREAEMNAGASSEEVNAGGVQARVFGTVKAGWRIYLEGTWAGVTRHDSDAFGSAFPYDNRPRLMETYVEKTMRPAGLLVGLKAGRYRTPFGIYNRSDHAYTGFLRAPLIRYGGNWALSNVALETGGAVLIGTPSLSVETSIGVPQDAGPDQRPHAIDTVVRAQGFYRSLVVGASYVNSVAYREGPWVTGRMIFKGVDARWMRGGVLLRGEWIDGLPFTGVATRGGYVDLMVHRIAMGPVTAVARADRLDYDAGEFSAYYRRYTVGARVRLHRQLSVQMNVVRQPDGKPSGHKNAFDLGLTQTIRF